MEIFILMINLRYDGKYEIAVEKNDTKTQQELLADPLYKVYILYDTNAVAQLPQLLKRKKQLELKIKDQTYIY